MPNKPPNIFFSYAQVDGGIVRDKIIPSLRQAEVPFWNPLEEIEAGKPFMDTIVETIKKSDLVICYLNSYSIYVNFEIGIALGNNKPILAIISDKSFENFRDLRHLHYFYFEQSNKNVAFELRNTIQKILENVIDKGTFQYHKPSEVIGIRAGTISGKFEDELALTKDFIELIKLLTSNSYEVSLISSSKGTLKNIIDFKPLVELVEKIIFIVPEWKKRKAENLKIEADTDKIRAEAEKTRAEAAKVTEEARQTRVETDIKALDAFIKFTEKHEKTGFDIQLGDRLLIKSEDGTITLKEPPRIE